MTTTKVVELKGNRAQAAVAKREDKPAAPRKRVPWSGGLNEQELARDGGLLLAALYECANERGELLQDMAKELGVTYGYLSQLRSGLRSVSTISDDFARACAKYLGITRYQVLMMAGRCTPQDLYANEASFETEVRNGMAALARDPEMKGLLTHQLLTDTSLESQYALVRLYEKATQKVLLSSRIDPATVASEVQSVLDHRTASAKAAKP